MYPMSSGPSYHTTPLKSCFWSRCHEWCSNWSQMLSNSVFPLVYQQPHSAVSKLQMSRTKSLMRLEGKVIASTSCSGQTSDTDSLHTRCTCISMILHKYFYTSRTVLFQEDAGLAGIVLGTQVSSEGRSNTQEVYLYCLGFSSNTWANGYQGGPKDLDTNLWPTKMSMVEKWGCALLM